MRQRTNQAYRPGTLANQKSHHILYMAFCLKFELSPLPAATDVLQLFVEFLMTTYSSPKSVLNVVSSVKTLHLALQLDTAAFQSYDFSLTKRSLLINVRHFPTRAPPLPPSLLNALVALSLKLGPQGTAFATLLALAFCTLARLSSLVPVSPTTPDITRVPVISDLSVARDGFSLNLKWSKTLQAADRAVSLPIVKASSSPSCPVTLLTRLLSQLRSAPPNTPLFAWPTSSLSQPFNFFTVRLARSWLNNLLDQCPGQGSGFTFHSFRRGGSTAAFQEGASLDEVKALGTWSSDSALLYIPQALARRRAAHKLVSQLRA